MHVLCGLNQLNMSIRNGRPGGIKHTSPKTSRNLGKRHRRSHQSKKQKSEKNATNSHGKKPLLKRSSHLHLRLSDELRKQGRSRLEKGRNQPTRLKSHTNEARRFNPYSQTIRQRFVADRATVASAVICSFPPAKEIVLSTEAAHAFASSIAEKSASPPSAS
jgi:hypothetical protein